MFWLLFFCVVFSNTSMSDLNWNHVKQDNGKYDGVNNHSNINNNNVRYGYMCNFVQGCYPCTIKSIVSFNLFFYFLIYYRINCNKRSFNDVFDNDESTNLQPPLVKRRKKMMIVNDDNRNKIINETTHLNTAGNNRNVQTYRYVF